MDSSCNIGREKRGITVKRKVSIEDEEKILRLPLDRDEHVRSVERRDLPEAVGLCIGVLFGALTIIGALLLAIWLERLINGG